MLNRYWSWTTGEAEPAESGLPFGPLRFRAWTDGEAAAAEAGLPFGPLRFRAWTSASGELPGTSGIPFGPLRFRAWTNGEDVVVIPPTGISGGSYRQPIRITVSELDRMRLQRDDELLLFIVSAAVACGLLD